MPMATIDIDRTERPAELDRRMVTHVDVGCYVTPHSHGWQPARYPRCSARFWCASCRVWFDGGRCFPPRPY